MATINIKLVLISAAFLINSVRSDDAAASSASAAASSAVPPPPPPPPPAPVPGIGGFGGLGGLGGLFPGLGGGFHKSLDFNAGAGFSPFLGGLGGFGGAPPVPVGPIEGDPGIGGGFPPFGFLGPSYIPSSWLGSALGAKGDLLFPLVIFVFFVVGVWTIVQFLLGLIVPLIAAKVSVLQNVNPLHRRSLSPEDEKQEQVDHLTSAVWAAFENFGCMKTSACYTGNIIHSIAGSDKAKEYEGTLNAMKVMDPEIVGIFKKAVESGKEDCSKYPCHNLSNNSTQSHKEDNHV